MKKEVVLSMLILTAVLASFRTSAQETIPEIRLLLVNEEYDQALKQFNKSVSLNIENAELWYLGGMAYSKLMRQDSSLVCFQKAASLEPEDDRIANALATVYMNMKQYTSAKNIYLEMIARDSTKFAPHISLATLYQKNSETRKALEVYLMLHEREPGNYSFMKSIAMCHMILRNDPAAVTWYVRAHEQYNGDLSINVALSQLYMKMKNFKDGLEIAERGLEVDRLNQELLFWSGVFNYATGFYQQAIVRLHNAERSGNDSPNVKRYLGICYYLTENYEKAREYLEMIAMDAEDYRIFNYLGIIYRTMDDHEISEKYFFNSLGVLEPCVDCLTETYLNLIDTYKATNNNVRIKESYESALVLDSENPFLYYGLAYTFDHYLKQKEAAVTNYQKFLDIASGNRDKHSDLPSLIDYSATRVKSLKEDIFFND